MTHREWLDCLKVDDEVVLYSGHSSIPEIKIVLRTTRTQILIDHPSRGIKFDRYRRKDGYDVGGERNLYRSRIEKPMPNTREKIRRYGLMDEFKRVELSDYDTDAIEAALLALRGG